MKEIWKDVPNYEDLYQISNLGRIKTKNKLGKDRLQRCYIKNSIICSPNLDSSGYKQIVLSKNKKRNTHKIHRLVAQAFIPNPNNYPCINHKDENKLNNYVDNLEWCTHLYNCNYGSRTYRCTRHRLHKVRQLDLYNNVINEYNSLQEAEKCTGIKYQGISACCRNIQKSSGGYIWQYY